MKTTSFLSLLLYLFLSPIFTLLLLGEIISVTHSTLVKVFNQKKSVLL